jgi:hypothetical protein
MQKIDHNIGFWEKLHFFAEICQKSKKIVIITSTLGLVSTQGVGFLGKTYFNVQLNSSSILNQIFVAPLYNPWLKL